MFRAAPVRQFMQPGAFVALGRCRGGGAGEQTTLWQLDEIAVAIQATVSIEGTLTAIAEFSAGCDDESIDVFKALGEIWTQCNGWQQFFAQLGRRIDLVNRKPSTCRQP